MRLDRHARLRKGPGRPELPDDRGLVEAAARGLEEPARRLEDLVRRGPSVARELRRRDAALRGPSRMERLRHRAEILAQARRLAARDRQGAGGRLGIEAHEL